MAVVDEFFNTIVEGERRQGIPDEQIARDLGISVERLRQLYPPQTPTYRPRGSNPHLHNNIGPFPDAPYVAPLAPSSENGGGIGLLVLLFVLAS